MKRLIYPLFLLAAILIVACGGGRSVNPLPEDISDGMKELRNGIGWYQKGCYQKSLENFTRACELFAASDHLAGSAMCMNNLGNVYRFIGDPQSALLFFDEAYAIFSDLKQHEGVIQALANKSAVLIQQQRLQEAETVIQRAESLAAAAKSVSIPLLNNKGVLLTKKKDYPGAENTFRQAMQEAQAGDLRSIATLNASMGNLKMEIGAYDQAVEFFGNALEADRKSEFQVGLAEDLTAIGTAYFHQNRFDPALKYLSRGIKIHAIFGNQEKIAHILDLMETASRKSGTDIRVTLHWVEKWRAGDQLENPCR